MKSLFPKTLNLSTPTIRNQKTLIWLQTQKTTVNWSNWDGVVTSIDSFKYWSKFKTNIIGIILIEPVGQTSDEIDGFLEDLYNVSKYVSLILLSQNVFSLKPQEYWTDNFDNILNLSNISNQYPYIKNGWDGSINDAVTIFALLCRYNRVIDCDNTSNRALPSEITFKNNIFPNEVWLITQFFQHKDENRYLEIKECLEHNCNCKYIDKIVLINEKDYSKEYKSLDINSKIQQIITKKRLTYSDFIRYVYEKVPENVFVILSNADIYFDESLKNLWKINMEDRMLGLLRWDVRPKTVLNKSSSLYDAQSKQESKLFGPRSDSQDSWIFLTDSIKKREWDYSKFNFQLGQAGCDNVFTGLILRQKFVISNPALTIKTHHIHNTNIRNYNSNKDFIKSDIYVNITPTYILDNKQELTPNTAPKIISNELVEFEIKSSSISNEITYCTMLEKEGRYKWEPSIENHYFQASIPIYSWKNAAVTPNGLVYDLYNIYKGKYSDDEQYNYWNDVNVELFTPLQYSEKMISIPVKNTDIFNNPDIYILEYMSRCARLFKQYPEYSFWIPKEFTKYIEIFNWNVDKLKGVYFNNSTPCWADEVIGYLPGPQIQELGVEEINTLRSMYPEWVEKPTNKTCTVIISSDITQKFVEERITPFLQEKDKEWTVKYILESDYASYGSLLGTSLCIFIGGKDTSKTWSKLWALPKECIVIEFQQELKIDGEFQHLAHISGFKSWVLLLAKGPTWDVQEQIMEALTKWSKKNDELL